MQLTHKNAVLYGATGATGRALAHAFIAAGATVSLTGRHREPLAALAAELGPRATFAVVDALDEAAVDRHLATLERVDLSFNAIGMPQTGIQGIPLAQLGADAFMAPLQTYLRAHFLTARAALRRMVTQRAGVILVHTPSPVSAPAPLVGGMGPAWAALEALTRFLSVEAAPHGVRALALQTTGIVETGTIAEVYGLHAAAIGVTPAQFQQLIESRTHRQRSTSLAELAAAAVFAASDGAAAITGTTLNLTGGMSAH